MVERENMATKLLPRGAVIVRTPGGGGAGKKKLYLQRGGFTM